MAEGVASKLLALSEDLRQNDENLDSFVGLLEARFRSREREVCSFVPEANRFQRLRREAEALRQKYPDPELRPPLYGVPVGVKDVFHVQGFLTRAGSSLPPEDLHGLEADCVTALKTAGALILGKTVSTEFAYFAPGPTRNPKHPDHTPGGSSSGSAAAVGAGLCPLTLGTQTIGSISRPAAFCGVVGYKPSYDRISRSGLIPLAPSLDHVGIFTADVAGASLPASLLSRGWKTGEPGEPEEPLSRPVLGIPEGPYLERVTAEGREHFDAVVDRLQAADFTVKRIAAMPDFDHIETRHGVIVAAEAARVHARWFPRFSQLYHEKTAELVRRGQEIPPKQLQESIVGCGLLRKQLSELMDEHGFDLWISPAAPGAAPVGLASTGQPVMNLPWTHSGLPTLAVPAGRNVAGLPLGLQLTARWWADEKLLAWGTALEEVVA